MLSLAAVSVSFWSWFDLFIYSSAAYFQRLTFSGIPQSNHKEIDLVNKLDTRCHHEMQDP